MKRAIPEPGERWGILGGSFDPVHLGHIRLVLDIADHEKLQGVFLIPSFSHPLKKVTVEAPYRDRLAMLRLAASSYPQLVILEIEKELGLAGFTIDTVRALKKRFGGVEFSFIIGADNIERIESWYKPEEIFEEVTVVAGARPGFELSAGALFLASRIHLVETSPIDVSSSKIRRLVKEGIDPETLTMFLETEVAIYIKRQKLYR